MSEFEFMSSIPKNVVKCPICEQYPTLFFDGEEYIFDCKCFFEYDEDILTLRLHWNKLMKKIQDKIEDKIKKEIQNFIESEKWEFDK